MHTKHCGGVISHIGIFTINWNLTILLLLKYVVQVIAWLARKSSNELGDHILTINVHCTCCFYGAVRNGFEASHPTKPLRFSAIKTTGTLVVFCAQWRVGRSGSATSVSEENLPKCSENLIDWLHCRKYRAQIQSP